MTRENGETETGRERERERERDVMGEMDVASSMIRHLENEKV
jgi:hypothetical protein